jgi:hypothetical protein
MSRYIVNFEEKVKPYIDTIFNFFGKHWYFTIKASQLICLWFIICIAIISMLGAIGFDTVNKDIEQRHVADTISIKEYNSWNTFIKPIMSYVFWTMQILVYIIFAILFYIIYKFLKKIEEIRNK